MNRPKQILLLLLFAVTCALRCAAAEKFVSFNSDGIKLCGAGEAFTICVGADENVGVKIAAKNLAADFGKVCGTFATISSNSKGCRVVIGTMGTAAAKELVKAGRIDEKQLRGKREKYVIGTMDEGGSVLYIVGSDRRGTIYGIYELSRQIGVSPWYWMADAPIARHDSLYISKGTFTDGEPKVKYRGIFINDEWPSFGTWCNKQFGGVNHKAYSRIFELLLRLKANYFWPAMWASRFNEDDPLSPKVADDMGIVMGTSHHVAVSRLAAS